MSSGDSSNNPKPLDPIQVLHTDVMRALQEYYDKTGLQVFEINTNWVVNDTVTQKRRALVGVRVISEMRR